MNENDCVEILQYMKRMLEVFGRYPVNQSPEIQAYNERLILKTTEALDMAIQRIAGQAGEEET